MKRKVEDIQFSSHRSILLEKILTRELEANPSLYPEKKHYRNSWRSYQDTVYWIKLSHAQDRGLQSGQTKSNAIVVNDHEPGECIHIVTSQREGHVFEERMQIPSPKNVILKSRWKIEHEQSSEDESADAWRDWKSTQTLVSEEIIKIEALDEQ